MYTNRFIFLCCIHFYYNTIAFLKYILGGALAFKALMPNRHAFKGMTSLWSVWQMVLGDTMSSDLKFLESDVWDERGDGFDWAVATSFVGKVMSGGFVFVVVTILMNQLIALMGDSYDRVQENYVVQARISRARVIVDMMDLYVAQEDKIVFARWIHVLRPSGAHARNGRKGWEGRLKAVKKAVSNAEKKITEKLTDEMAMRMKIMEDNLGYKIDEVLKKIMSSKEKK